MATIVQDTIDAEASDALFDEVGNVDINGIVRAAITGTNTVVLEKKEKGEADGKDKVLGKNQNDGGTDRKAGTQNGQATETEGTGAKGATKTPARPGPGGTGTTTGGITQFTRQTSTETTNTTKPQNTPQLKEAIDTGKLSQQSQLENLADGLDETGEKAA